MRVSGILATKGTAVATIAPTERVGEAVERLRAHGVGALVVSVDGARIDGIISERDVVRHLAERGAGVLDEHVSVLMTVGVHTCTPDDHVEDLMRRMTDLRARHLPVVVDGDLAGIISIGDVVKWRVTELEDEARQLHDYITTGR
jgi:CBS domain-containing protein